MTCLMFKAAKTYKKMPKNEIMLECFLACQKKYKIIKWPKKCIVLRILVLKKWYMLYVHNTQICATIAVVWSYCFQKSCNPPHGEAVIAFLSISEASLLIALYHLQPKWPKWYASTWHQFHINRHQYLGNSWRVLPL